MAASTTLLQNKKFLKKIIKSQKKHLTTSIWENMLIPGSDVWKRGGTCLNQSAASVEVQNSNPQRKKIHFTIGNDELNPSSKQQQV